MSNNHRDLIQRYCDAFERGEVDALESIVHPDVVDHSAYEAQQPGIEGYRQFFRLWNDAFPDLKFNIEMTVQQDDVVAYRWTASGTHLGQYHEHPPTGRTFQVSGISINRIKGGRIIEEWVEIDHLGLLQQLGLVE